MLAVLSGFFLFIIIFRFPSENKDIQSERSDESIENTLVSEDGSGNSNIDEVPEKPEDILSSDKIAKEENESSSSKNSEKETKNDFEIIQKPVNWGYSSSNNRTIDTIIIHSSYNALGGSEYDLDKLILEYKEYGVAPHYLIDRKGKIYQLVKNGNIAYHAGESKMSDGRTNVNNFSIGIELMNTESDKYTGEQYASLEYLISYLKESYKIKYVLGHNSIASGRKTDPWNFNWDKID